MKEQRTLNKEHQELVHAEEDLRIKMLACDKARKKVASITDKIVLQYMNAERKDDKS